MLHPSSEFLGLIGKATHSDGIAITLDELLSALKLSESGLLLENVEQVRTLIDAMGFELIPTLSFGDFKSERILRSKNRSKPDGNIVRNEIANGESSSLEFKSSLMFDYNKFTAAPNLSLQQYNSEKVISSCLKTIAAFINTDGGVLYLGVEDKGRYLGLEKDCLLIGCKEFDADKWQLHLRNLIKTRFKEGTIVNDYVDIDIICVDGVFLARIKVLPRRRLTFVSDKEISRLVLYRRQGNTTTVVEIDEVEEFLSFRAMRI